MSTHVHLRLLLLTLLVSPCLGESPAAYDATPSTGNTGWAGGRSLFGDKSYLEERLAKAKAELEKKTKENVYLDKKASNVKHDIKVTLGYRGKQSRLEKLDEENHLKLCWWPETFPYAYVANILNGDADSDSNAGAQYNGDFETLGSISDLDSDTDSFGIQDSDVRSKSNTQNYGIHFKVPHDMQSFKFIEPPSVRGDPNIDSYMNLQVRYFVARVKGPYEISRLDTEDNYRHVDEVLYFGSNPPSEFPVKHKDHMYISVIRLPGVGGHTITQVAPCADLGDRLGTPVSFAVSFTESDQYIYAYGGYAQEFGGPYSLPGGTLPVFKTLCPLVPVQASRCY